MSETASPPPTFTPPPLPPEPPDRPLTRQERVHALLGAFAFVPFSSEDHIRQKEKEKELEE